ncbi:PIN domain-containing protein [Nitrincola sp. MINF-07-Sa-05]|uniref:PIN domain-containing protein n=1 Tax=Nitrincola salilacus TaxID=3400273 RepID=UPI003917DBE1
MARFTVVLDACVLYPAVVRDAALRLSMTGLFKAHWTDAIHDEWTTALKKERLPDGRQRYSDELLYRTRALMDQATGDAKVDGYESLIESLVLPDPQDRHVVAAAIKVNADAIVTYNLKDFPAEYLAVNFGLEVIHPDDFFRYQFDLNPGLAVRAFHNQLSALKRPPLTKAEFLIRLKRCQLIQTAHFLESFL